MTFVDAGVCWPREQGRYARTVDLTGQGSVWLEWCERPEDEILKVIQRESY